MDRARLLAELAEADPGSGEAVFIERVGDDYRWPLDQPYPPGH